MKNKICMKYITKNENSYIVRVRAIRKSYKKTFNFKDFINEELALAAAVLHRNEICELEQIPVVNKNVVKITYNRSGVYNVYTKTGRIKPYYYKGVKVLDEPKDGLMLIKESDVKNYGSTVKRLVIKNKN